MCSDDDDCAHQPPVVATSVRSDAEVRLDMAVVHASVEPLSVEWQDLHCWVPARHNRYLPRRHGSEWLEIIHGTTGRAAEGELVGVLGPSGSGKSTLLTALSFRFSQRRMKISPDSVTFNGVAWNKSLKTRIGLVEQEDCLLGDLTVRQTLRFGALLRGKGIAQADALIHALNLTSCAEQAIGGANIERQISGGQRRRVSIGVELILDPSLLLTDESTSGLDSAAAARIFGLLVQLSESRRSVIATLHQPTDAMLWAFTTLALMVNGECAYFGDPHRAGPLFEARCVRQPGQPVADFLLQFLYDGTPIPTTAAPNKSNKSLPQSDAHQLSALEASRPLTWWQETRILAKRSYLAHRFDVLDSMFLLNVCSITACSTLLWWGIAARRPRSSRDVEDIAGLLFFQLVYWGFQMMIVALFAFPAAIDVIKKERAAGLYRISAFAVARTAVDSATAALIAPSLSFIYYFAVGLRPAGLPGHLLVHLLNGLVAHSAGLCIGAWFFDIKRAAAVQTIGMLVSMMLGGFYVSFTCTNQSGSRLIFGAYRSMARRPGLNLPTRCPLWPIRTPPRLKSSLKTTTLTAALQQEQRPVPLRTTTSLTAFISRTAFSSIISPSLPLSSPFARSPTLGSESTLPCEAQPQPAQKRACRRS